MTAATGVTATGVTRDATGVTSDLQGHRTRPQGSLRGLTSRVESLGTRLVK